MLIARWIVRLAWSATEKLIFSWIKDHPWWIVAGGVMSGFWTWVGILPWYMWGLAFFGGFSFFMAIRDTLKKRATSRAKQQRPGELYRRIHPELLATRDALISFLDGGGTVSAQWVLAELTARKIHLENECQIPCPDLPDGEEDTQVLKQWRGFLYPITELASHGRVKKARSVLE